MSTYSKGTLALSRLAAMLSCFSCGLFTLRNNVSESALLFHECISCGVHGVYLPYELIDNVELRISSAMVRCADGTISIIY